MQQRVGRWTKTGALLVAATCPAPVLARPADPYPLPVNRVIVADTAARLTRTTPAPRTRPAEPAAFAGSLSTTDRFDLASVRSRAANLALGAATLTLSANRAANLAQRQAMPWSVDRWAMKGVGARLSAPLLPDVGVALDGEYARMVRRLDIVNLNPHRLATSMAKAGAALEFGEGGRLALDYVSVARSSGHSALTRFAEAIGGAPLTGHGAELSLAASRVPALGNGTWSLSFSAMRRPARDLGLADGPAMLNDAGARMGFSLPL